ncbi:MAG: hypothetical protein BWY76_03412 [bacterium ADurb.Bin429]|nr:MAG: hypothetical protein BWY76_03412 [bacterium ADurb.Bin429]
MPAPHAVAEPLHALVFSAFPHITHELYPLMVDACVAAPALRVVGVHVDWLHKGRVTRAITYDVERDLLVEAPLAETVVPTTAQVLGLNLCHEHADHRRIAAELPGTRLLNPPAGAALLDDKARTAACWQRVNLDTPAFAAYPADLVAFVAENGSRIVIKPGDGTEGRAVGIFDLHQPVQRAAAFRHLDELGANALVTVERGTVRACTDKGPVRCVIRINVCWDGARAWAESGYAQLAGSQGIASAGRGGRVIALSDLWRRLCREDGTPLTPSPGDWRCLLATAENGTRALAGELDGTMPALIGLDLLLDVANNDSLLPILLEANPRPSGMARCTLLTANTPTGDPGIAPHLWPCIVARLA